MSNHYLQSASLSHRFVCSVMTCHSLEKVETSLNDDGLTIMSWLARSPNLILIENIWKVTGYRIQQKKSRNSDESRKACLRNGRKHHCVLLQWIDRLFTIDLFSSFNQPLELSLLRFNKMFLNVKAPRIVSHTVYFQLNYSMEAEFIRIFYMLVVYFVWIQEEKKTMNDCIWLLSLVITFVRPCIYLGTVRQKN